jgi:D-amino peptidase
MRHPRRAPAPRPARLPRPVRASAAALALALAACGAWTEAAPAEARVLEDPRPVAADGPRVLLYYDMDGLAGIDDPNAFRFAHPEAYARGREALVAEVNAVVDGLFAGGATLVRVVDAHGSGNPEPDLPPDRLDARAEMIFHDRPFRQYVDLDALGDYDAIAVVGMHPKTGSGGFAPHTFTLGIDMEMNGMSLTETELIGYSWGRRGVPVIFAAGDEHLARELAGPMPWLDVVVGKRATSASTAEPRPAAQVHAELREGARRALERRDDARAMRLSGPVRAALRVAPPASLDILREVPGVEHGDDRVEFTAPDFQAAYDGLVGLVTVARSGYQQVLLETIRARPDGEAILAEYSDRLFERWLDSESGRWSPPPAPTPPAGRRYHGAS